MKSKTIYMITADYGGMENFFEAAFTNENDRNEIALAVAEEIEHANFNLNVAAWMNTLKENAQNYTGVIPMELAVGYALQPTQKWEAANELVITWEVNLFE